MTAPGWRSILSATFGVGIAPIVLALFAASLAALSQAIDCDDIEFNASATEEFPSVARSCHSIVERDGKLYVRLVADVVRVRSDGSMLLDLKNRDGSRFRQEFSSSPSFRAMISGEPRPTRDLSRGQEIRLYLPSDRWQVRRIAENY